MAGMLEQLYDLARVRLAGGITLNPHDADFRALTEKVAEEFRLAYPARSVLVEYDGGSTAGNWDELRLSQMLANLVGNALRHGAAEQPVVIRVSGAAPLLVVDVHNGGAIPVDIRPHLFDPFRRGSEDAPRDTLGLGLYIVRQIVLAHGGTIDVDSSPEAGTTFRVELPRTTPRGVTNGSPT
jgi:signal transduction histidine kinase